MRRCGAGPAEARDGLVRFRHNGVDVVVVSCQPRDIPAEMRMGLSPPVREAAAEAARLIHERYLRDGR